MKDIGKSYESELSFRDFNSVEGMTDSVLGKITDLTGKLSLVSIDIEFVSFMKLIESLQEADNEEEFHVLVHPEKKKTAYVVLPDMFLQLLFQMVSHGIEEDDFRVKTMQAISEGIRVGLKNAKNEGDK